MLPIKVRAKKHLGQHFLTDPQIALRIVEGIKSDKANSSILEIGPGKGILTEILISKFPDRFWAMDIDRESIDYLYSKFPEFRNRILFGDFLHFTFARNLSLDKSHTFDKNSPLEQNPSLDKIHNFDNLDAVGSLPIKDSVDSPIPNLFITVPNEWSIIGNFPYNISSQIVFKILENRNQIIEMVGMFQKEVADRFRAKKSTKEYGILSVLVQAFYKVEYLFTVKPGSFYPPPKVVSAVVRFHRKDSFHLECNEELFFKVVKAGFNQRRKMLRNALESNFPKIKEVDAPFKSLRAEALTLNDFIELTNYLEDC